MRLRAARQTRQPVRVAAWRGALSAAEKCPQRAVLRRISTRSGWRGQQAKGRQREPARGSRFPGTAAASTTPDPPPESQTELRTERKQSWRRSTCAATATSPPRSCQRSEGLGAWGRGGFGAGRSVFRSRDYRTPLNRPCHPPRQVPSGLLPVLELDGRVVTESVRGSLNSFLELDRERQRLVGPWGDTPRPRPAEPSTPPPTHTPRRPTPPRRPGRAHPPRAQSVIMQLLEEAFPDNKPLMPPKGTPQRDRADALMRLERRFFGSWWSAAADGLLASNSCFCRGVAPAAAVFSA